MRPSPSSLQSPARSVMPCRPMGRKDRFRNSMSAVEVSPTTATSRRQCHRLTLPPTGLPGTTTAHSMWVFARSVNAFALVRLGA